MRMYIWTAPNPDRDCAFEAGVVIHEYTHGRKYLFTQLASLLFDMLLLLPRPKQITNTL